jgi:cell division protein FtsB
MFEEVWVLIPLAPFILGGFAIWSRHKQKELELMSQTNTERAAQYAAQNERLEQRVQVLERIITDKSSSLSDAIEDLRDKPLN